MDRIGLKLDCYLLHSPSVHNCYGFSSEIWWLHTQNIFHLASNIDDFNRKSIEFWRLCFPGTWVQNVTLCTPWVKELHVLQPLFRGQFGDLKWKFPIAIHQFSNCRSRCVAMPKSWASQIIMYLGTYFFVFLMGFMRVLGERFRFSR